MKILNLNLVTMLEYQNIKIFFQTFILPISLKKCLLLKKIDKESHNINKSIFSKT